MYISRRAFVAGTGAIVLTGFRGSSDAGAETWDIEKAGVCGATSALRIRKINRVTDAPPDARLVTREIAGLVGLVPNFGLKEGDFEKGWTAIAIVHNGMRYIVFDRKKFDWRSGRPSWQDIAILAHEIGHHLNGHTIDGVGSRWQTESEADWFAGFVIAGLGGTLEDALRAFGFLGEKGSTTHPPRRMRLRAVEAGWRHAKSIRTAPSSWQYRASPYDREGHGGGGLREDANARAALRHAWRDTCGRRQNLDWEIGP